MSWQVGFESFDSPERLYWYLESEGKMDSFLGEMLIEDYRTCPDYIMKDMRWQRHSSLESYMERIATDGWGRLNELGLVPRKGEDFELDGEVLARWVGDRA